MDELYAKLFDIGCIKFGEFKLKSGIMSPVYVDFRILVSHPDALGMVAEKMVEMVRPLEFDRIAGLPYAGLPIAVAMSLAGNLPMIYPRKEVKDYGTGKSIEGKYEQGERVLIVDDVITDGGAKIEAVEPLARAGLEVKDVAVILDREQGGGEILAGMGYKLHALMTLSQALDSLVRQGRVFEEMRDSVRVFIAEHQFGKA
jgi:uridine monophosphate synthetase